MPGDPQRAFDYALRLRWPDGNVTCPRCGKAKHSFIKTRRIWFCYVCQKQFSLKVGTIFEDSPLGLDKWMTLAIYPERVNPAILWFSARAMKPGT